SIYGEEAFKQIGSIMGFIIGFIMLLLKAGIIVLMYFLNKNLMDGGLMSFLMLFIIFSLLINVFIPITFNSNRDADYLVTHLRMDPKKYLLTNYLVDLIKAYIAFTPVLIVIMHLMKANILLAFVLPLVYLSMSISTTALKIKLSYKKGVIAIVNFLVIMGVMVFLYLYLFMYDTYSFAGIAIALSLIFLITGIISTIYLIKYNKYHKTFKLLYTSKLEETEFKEANLKAITASIEYDNTTSNLDGFDFIHELFVKRHRKMLTKPVNTATLWLGVIVLFLCLITYFFDMKESIHKFLMNGMPYIALIMYFINRGDQICKAMFMNCDCALLNYRLYRSPRTILEMFTRRLKTAIKLNLFPAMVMAVGGVLLLLITNDTNVMNYVLFVLTIISMSMFFSIHYLVMYYLLQPFSENTEVKNKAYSFINILVYLVCYFPAYMEIPLPLHIIGPVVIIFTIIYSIVGLLLTYKLAPKTFKIRL
ncbi:MAG: hypothetical protein II625_03695, partial [Bacilli bacterium]|nr:hypothetical protein [Bacilli bacterium]